METVEPHRLGRDAVAALVATGNVDLFDELARRFPDSVPDMVVLATQGNQPFLLIRALGLLQGTEHEGMQSYRLSQALEHAIIQRFEECARLLVKAAPKPQHALHIATEHHWPSLVRDWCSLHTPEAKSAALLDAALEGHAEVVALLLEDPSVRPAILGALHRAALMDMQSCVDKLVLHCNVDELAPSLLSPRSTSACAAENLARHWSADARAQLLACHGPSFLPQVADLHRAWEVSELHLATGPGVLAPSRRSARV